MEVIKSKDNKVTKYIHGDGSETVVKTESSCGNEIDKDTGEVKIVEKNRNKFSVFISSSYGCPLGCKFCYLTNNGSKYTKLSNDQIISNVKEALVYEANNNPTIRRKYMKLSWMGMGDAFLLDPLDLRTTTERILSFAIGDYGCATGLDGVDISTVFPKNNSGWPHQLSLLNDRLHDKYRINNYSEGRSLVRLFYSLHAPINRKNLIPCSRYQSPIHDLKIINKFSEWYGINIVIHHMFLDGVNDNKIDLEGVVYLMNSVINGAEFRILRYNKYDGSEYYESTKFDELVKEYSSILPNVKYQISHGNDINASCGLFNGKCL